MIHTTIRDIARYYPLIPGGEKVFSEMKKLCESDFCAGRHDVDGDNIFINAAEYTTKPASASVLEAHRKYIDVMLLLEGEETIGVCDAGSAVETVKEYYEKIEAALYKLPEKYTGVYMKKGDVCVLFPEDCHAPGMEAGEPCKVKKLIGKIRII